ncbi:hypothetical protein KR067_010483 [Drosophila pandora]|nr:hypothetical protein KR067_010483 [Drosophila pandora]
MPEDEMVPAGSYKLTKQFRSENAFRSARDMPWSRKILDLEKKKLCGRTAWAWIRVVMYFGFLYLTLIAFFCFWHLVFNSFFNDEGGPRWLKGPPGLSVFPTNDSTISYYQHLMADIYPLADRIDEYIFNLDDNAEDYFEECNHDDLWGFPSGKPCLFVKLNYVLGYIPATYDTPGTLPADAPAELADIITKYSGVSKIWLTCEVTAGPAPKFQYIPGPYYTLADEKLPAKPLGRVVAVQLNELKPNSKTFVKCSAWARNIPIDTEFNGIGHVKFSVEMRTETVQKPGVDNWKTTAPPPIRSHDHDHDHDNKNVMPFPQPDDEKKQDMKADDLNSDFLNKPALPMMEPPEGVLAEQPMPPKEPPEGGPYDEPPTEAPSL